MNIIVTGGSSGLGKAVVERLSQDENNHICFTYNRHREEALGMMDANPRIEAIQCDFCKMEEVGQFIQEIAAFDADVLINNAYVGSPQGKHFHKTDFTDFEQNFLYNLLPVIRITQTVISQFRKKKFGKIINVLTSALLNLPPVGYAVYAANKAYLQQLSKSWNSEYSRYNITSNCVSPDFMQTNLSGDIDARIVEQIKNTHPLQVLLTPEEVAEVVAYFVYASQQVNGVNIPINAAQNIIK